MSDQPGLTLPSGVIAKARTKPRRTVTDLDGNICHDPEDRGCQCARCVPDPFAGLGHETGRVYRRSEYRSI